MAKPKAVSSRVQQHCSRFAKNTSIHGILYAYVSESKFGKIFWVCLFVSMCTMAVYFSYRTIQRFMEHPDYTISYQTTEKETNIEIPDIVFCFGVDKDIVSKLPRSLIPFQKCPKYFYFTTAEIEAAAFQSTCEIEGFHMWYSAAYIEPKLLHVCYRMRIPHELISPPNLDTSKTFYFDIAYLPLMQHENLNPSVFILPRLDTFDARDHEGELHLMSSTSSTRVKIKSPRMNYLLPENKGGSCVNPDEKKLKYFEAFSERNCEVECVIDISLKELNCTPWQPLLQIDRLYNITKAYPRCSAEEKWKHGHNSCVQNCMPACKHWVYDVSKEQYMLHHKRIEARWEHYYSEVESGKLLNFSSIVSSEHEIDPELVTPFYEIWFSFPSRYKFTITREKTVVEVETFISSIGGVMSLYLGVSMISLVHVIVFILKLVYRVTCDPDKDAPPVSKYGSTPFSISVTKIM